MAWLRPLERESLGVVEQSNTDEEGARKEGGAAVFTVSEILTGSHDSYRVRDPLILRGIEVGSGHISEDWNSLLDNCPEFSFEV